MNELFVQALPILKKIEDNGFEAVFVGGSVRDALLNRTIHDVDIATSATPDEVKSIFSKTVDVGIQHGTVLVIENGESYEITTYRVESEYVDYRKPKEVKFIRSLQDDLQRRDFTMNAIAMNMNGDMIDPFGGQQAIQRAMIETVGNANDRFSEDALRMMRALRFVSQLSFTCSDETLQALKDNQDLLKNISIERITAEFEKLLCGVNVQEALQLLIDTNLFTYLPGFSDKKNELIQVAQYDLHKVCNVDEKWAVLLYYVVNLNEVESFLRAWRLPVKRIRHIRAILQAVYHENYDDKMTLFTNGIDCSLSAIRVSYFLKHQDSKQAEEQAIEIWNSLPIHDSSQVNVNGTLLTEWSNREKGPWIRETLHIITTKIINEELPNNTEAIYKEVHRCNLI
ncbi:CCA tRNA nucleotidyltransferase [Bacillus massiliigorillae]|uniref:CCA tRNA nucleotidyltransferase n=1 Tax=Bacillus massiliigorillae TaxID=1243664 RepID=UPI0003A6DBD4|nr:CCA tRNA nucleotidyltransferase [Bacillus massiliigorillae]